MQFHDIVIGETHVTPRPEKEQILFLEFLLVATAQKSDQTCTKRDYQYQRGRKVGDCFPSSVRLACHRDVTPVARFHSFTAHFIDPITCSCPAMHHCRQSRTEPHTDHQAHVSNSTTDTTHPITAQASSINFTLSTQQPSCFARPTL